MTKFVTKVEFWGCNVLFRDGPRSENEIFFRQGGWIFGDFVSIFWLFLVTMTLVMTTFIWFTRAIFWRFGAPLRSHFGFRPYKFCAPTERKLIPNCTRFRYQFYLNFVRDLAPDSIPILHPKPHPFCIQGLLKKR